MTLVASSSGTITGLGASNNAVLNQAVDFTNGVANLAGALVYTGTSGSMTFTATSSASSKTGTSNSVTLNAGALDHFAVNLATPQIVGAAFTGSCTVTAQDAGNNTITTFDASVDNVTVSSSAGGTITGLGSSNNAVLNQAADFTNGVADLSSDLVYTGTSGSMTFVATSNTSSRTGTSSSVVVNPGPLDHFAISIATPQVVSAAFTGACTIAAEDASNNTVTTFDASADNVTISSSAGGTITGLGSGSTAVLNQVADFTNGVANVAGILVYSGAPGSMTFTATGGTSSKTGTSSSVTLNAGGLDHFVVTVASPQAVGTAFSGTCTITAKDAINNTITTFDASTDNVTISSSAGGTVSGLGSGNNAVLNRAADFTSGVASLANALVYTGASGPMTFAATGATSAKTGTSSSVTVNVGTLDHFVVNIATPQIVGAAFSGTCAITAQDAGNNTVTTFDASSDNVTVVASSGGTITGLGSGNNAELDRAADFTAGVADLAGVIRYTGASGVMTFTATGSTSSKTGTSSGITMGDAVPIITTVVGDGTPNYAGDGSAATSAQLNLPSRVAADEAGNLYIADAANHRIRKVDVSTGLISTVAGDGTAAYGGDGGIATSAQLNTPYGVVVDALGNLYIADYGNHRVRRVATRTAIITTIAGTGAAGYSGDDGVASAAQLNNPRGVSLDGSGNLYIADTTNHRIRKIDAVVGIITTAAGTGVGTYGGDGGGATTAQLNTPYAVDADVAGNLYIADYGNNRIRRVEAATGLITTIAGTGVAGYSGDGSAATSAKINLPYGVAVDVLGNVYVADYGNHRIRKITTGTAVITTIAGTGTANYNGDGGAATVGQLSYPTGVGLDGPGNLYVADAGNHRVRKVRHLETLTITTTTLAYAPKNSACKLEVTALGGSGSGYTWTTSVGTVPTGTNLISGTPAASISGTPTLAGTWLFTLKVVDSEGFQATRAVSLQVGVPNITTVAGTGVYYYGVSPDGGLATATDIYSTSSVVVDPAGNFYFGESWYPRVRLVTASTGIITTVAGGNGPHGYSGDGGPATSATMHGAAALVLDKVGNLYVADAGNHRIRKVAASTGIITTVAGTGVQGYSGDGGPALSAQFDTPREIALDAASNVYIADAENHRIRKVDALTGIVSTVVGTGTAGFSGDGGPAISAQIDRPLGVAADPAGNLYISDYYNYRVRKVDASTGVITTVAGTGIEGYTGDGGAATSARIHGPIYVAVDPAGNIYLSDNLSDRIRKVDGNTGLITTVVGTGVSGYSGDGGPATSAEVDTPSYLTLDTAGNLYFCDTACVRKVGP